MGRPSPVWIFVARELTRGARRRSTWILRFAVTAALLAVLYGQFGMLGFHPDLSPARAQRLGQAVASGVALLAWLFLALALPPAVVSAVQEETQRGRGDLLALAGLSPRQVRLGAASARSITALIAMVAVLPGLALATSFGGVDPVVDGLTIGTHLAALVVEASLMAAWLAGPARGPLSPSAGVWLWLVGLALWVPLLLERAGLPSEVLKLLSGPITFLDMYSRHRSAGFDLLALVVHAPVVFVLARAPRLGAGKGALLAGSFALLAGLGAVMVGFNGGLLYLPPLGLALGAATCAWGVLGTAGLRWWSRRSTSTPTARVSPKAVRRWTDHIWDDSVAWRETVTNAYGVVNRIIGRGYIGAGVLAVLTLMTTLGTGTMDRTFYWLGAMAFATAVFVTVLASGASILEERGSDSLELLLLSRLGPKGILRGKARAALLLAGPAACVAILGLPAALGSAGHRALRGWEGSEMLFLLVTFVVWVPALLYGLGALVRLLCLSATNASLAWIRVAALVTATVLAPWAVLVTQRGYYRGGWDLLEFTAILSELLLPYGIGVSMPMRCVSAIGWVVAGLIAAARARRLLDRGRWPR